MSQAPSLTGTVVGHYELRELIGSGGMGDVYRGWDTHLNRPVAVKTLQPDLVADEQARERFSRETRLACHIVHPFVATVFDVVELQQRPLLVMEFVQGKTLNEVLREGPLPVETALRYAEEISEALAAIHEGGLVHRDMKPGNVMVTPDGHVKVMDFGLAQRRPTVTDDGGQSTLEASITQAGCVVGTPLYMSPEQLNGSTVDPRSDLFSLGVLLYECISGEHPFKRASMADSVAAILRDAPGATGRRLNCRPRALRQLIMRLLTKEPSARYQSVRELLPELRSIMDRLSGARTRRQVAVFAGSFAALSLLAYPTWHWVSGPPDGPRVVVAIAPFDDQTNETDGKIRASMVAELLATRLQGSRLARIAGPEVTTVFRSGPVAIDPLATARGLLEVVTADFALTGRLERVGSEYIATSLLVPASGSQETQTLEARSTDLSLLADELGGEVRRALPHVSALMAWRDERSAPTAVMAANADALLVYQRGLLALRDERLKEAAERFEQAMEIDPSFALAQGRLAETLNRLGYARRAREAATRALDLLPAANQHVDDRWGLELRAVWARLYARKTEEIETTGRLAAVWPDDPELRIGHARALDRAGHYDDALLEASAALKLDPLYPGYHVDRALILIHGGRLADALAPLARAEQIYDMVGSAEGAARVNYVRSLALTSLERYADAQTELDRATRHLTGLDMASRLTPVLMQRATIDTLRGLLDSADGHLAALAEIAEHEGDTALQYRVASVRGAGLFRRGQYEAAEPWLRRAIDIGRQLDNDFYVVFPLANLASLLGYVGRTDEARTAADDAVRLARELNQKDVERMATRTLSNLAYQAGDLDVAIASHRRLLDGQSEATRSTAWSWLSLTEMLTLRGQSADALLAADRAVDILRQLDNPGDLGYALVHRGRVLTELLRRDAARRDLDEATRIARELRLDELGVRCAVGRGIDHAMAGDWRSAIASTRPLIDEGSQPPEVHAMGLTLTCQALLAMAQTREAIPICRRAAALEGASAGARALSAGLLADGLLASGQRGEAEQVAVQALAETGRMDLLLGRARAAAVLADLDLPAPAGGAESYREIGLVALDRFVGAAPETDRVGLAQRADLASLRERLTRQDSATASSRASLHREPRR